jgi:hypothetical protein
VRIPRPIIVAIAITGCAEQAAPAPDPAGDPAALLCEAQADCGDGESCIDGVCQLSRCTDGPYASAPPLAEASILARDAELVAVGGSDDLIDATGARWRDAEREQLVAIRRGGRSLLADGAPSVDVGFVPHAIDAGDVDGDPLDEVIAVSEAGDIAICSAAGCDRYHVDAEIRDVAVGDVDGDLRRELVFLLGDADRLLIWNLDADETGESETATVPVPGGVRRIDAATVDGVAAIAAVVDGGWLGLASDRLLLWSLAGGELDELGRDDRRGLIDVAGGDSDGDGDDEVGAVDDGGLLLYRDQLARATWIADVAGAAAVAMIDVDGDSARASLVGGPELILGKLLPVMVLELPPYDAAHSDGRSSIFAGTTESTSETLSDTVSLTVGTTIGFSGAIPLAAEGSISASVSRTVAASRATATSLTVGDRFVVDAEPGEGDAWAAVVVSSACYHRYRYRIDDPRGALGGADGEISLLVPVAGTAGAMKSDRYNRMADALGLPRVDVGYTLGDPDSYPARPSLPDGAPVPADDQVFASPPGYLVSDVARVGWWLAVGDSETRSLSRTTGVDVAATVSVAGVKIGGSVGASAGASHSVTVGSDALFGGSVPPIRDLPDTAVDEHARHRFGFSPHVYRRRYRDADGNQAGYYVLSFTVSRP